MTFEVAEFTAGAAGDLGQRPTPLASPAGDSAVADAPAGDAAQRAGQRWYSRRPARLARLALILAMIAVEAVLLAPHISASGDALDHLRWGWVLAAIGCEVASLATFARLRRSLLRAGGMRMSLGRMGALTLATTAISSTVPAGSAVSTGYLYRQLRRVGASAPLVGWVLVAGGVISGLAFSLITMAGTMLSGDTSIVGIASAGGLSLLLVPALIALLTLITRHPQPVVRIYRTVCRRLPGRRAKTAATDEAIDRVVGQLTAITPRTRDWTVAFWFAIVNWAADLACFVLCCYAVGATGLGLGTAVLAYVAGLATTSISLLPGGLGSVDAGLLVGLTHGGIAGPIAVAGIITYRLVAYALFAVIGWVVYAGLRRFRTEGALTPQPVTGSQPASSR